MRNQIEIASLLVAGNNEHEHDLWAKHFSFLSITRIVNMLITLPDTFLPNIPTMLTALMQLVPVLDGSNYLPWAHAMTTYLKSQGLWPIVNGTEHYPVNSTTPKTPPSGSPSVSTYTVPKEVEKARRAYWLKNDQAMGTIMLCLTSAIADLCSAFQTVDDVWNHLKNEYFTPSLSYAYQQFKIAMNFKIDTARHPAPQIDYLQGVYSCLDEIKVKIPEPIQGMMLLNVVSTKWEALIPLVLSGASLSNLTVLHIKKFLINWWDSDQNKKSGKPPAAKTAQKISAVKRRKFLNTFASQQNTQSTLSNAKGKAPQGSKAQAKDKTKRGTHGGKGKKHEQHVHLATVTALPSPTTTTIAAIGPSRIEKHTASIGTDLPDTRDPKASLAFFPFTSHARTLAERIGEPPTQQIGRAHV